MSVLTRALLAIVLLAVVSVPVAAQTTLAAASAEAKKIVHEWPASGNAVPEAAPASAEPDATPGAPNVVTAIPDPPPAPTVLEAMRVQASALFQSRLLAVRAVMDRRASNRVTYDQACKNKLTVFAPVVIGLGVAAPVAFNETTPECRTLATEITAQAARIDSERREMLESARTKRIYPGVMRALFDGIGLAEVQTTRQ